jgi:hypothetical protein
MASEAIRESMSLNVEHRRSFLLNKQEWWIVVAVNLRTAHAVLQRVICSLDFLLSFNHTPAHEQALDCWSFEPSAQRRPS